MNEITKPSLSLLDAAYGLAAAGAAWIWPPLALLVCAGFLVATAIVNDRRVQ